MGLAFAYDLYLTLSSPRDCGHIFVSLTYPVTLQLTYAHTNNMVQSQVSDIPLRPPSCLLQSQDSSVFVLMYLVHRTVKYFVPAWTAILFIHPNKLIERGGVGGYLPIEDGSESLNWAQSKVCVGVAWVGNTSAYQ